MYIVGITEEDFIGSEAQLKSGKKQMLTRVKETSLNVRAPYVSGTLENIYMFKGVSTRGGRIGSPVAEKRAAATA